MSHPWVGVATLALMLLVGCGGGSARQQVLVSAAASLTDAFGDVERSFEEANPDIDIVLNLSGSSALREQILAGAPADVFASANARNMEAIVAAGGTAEAPEVFATNRLEIAVPADNPAGVARLEDFAQSEPLFGLCGSAVPCGSLAREAFQQAHIEPSIDTNEPDVRSLLTKIAAGELDAGIVYATDIGSAAGTVVGITIPAADNVAAQYTIAVLNGGRSSAEARAFVDFVLSAAGRTILAEHGFGSP